MFDVDIQVPWTGYGPHHSGFVADEVLELDAAFSQVRTLATCQQINANQDGKERIITVTIKVIPKNAN